jgi:hypothetical protein
MFNAKLISFQSIEASKRLFVLCDEGSWGCCTILNPERRVFLKDYDVIAHGEM